MQFIFLMMSYDAISRKFNLYFNRFWLFTGLSTLTINFSPRK